MISSEPPSRLSPEDLILRDHLAIHRTVLANERTMLAYTRTALATMVVGVSLIEFIDRPHVRPLGLLCVIVGGGILLVGLWRYRSMKARIERAYREFRP